MTNTTNAPSTALGGEATPAIPSPDLDGETASNFTPASYAIAPEDSAVAQAIANFDPVYDVPGPTTEDLGGLASLLSPEGLSGLTLASLSPDLRQKATDRIASAPPISEQGAIAEVLYDNAFTMNVLSGPGEGANPYQREAFAVARDIHDAQQESFKIELELMKGIGWENEVDERTGVSTPKQVDRMDPNRRSQLSHRRTELQRRLELLNGFEGNRRRERALHEAVEAQKKQSRELEKDEAAKHRAEEIVRDEDIEDRAKSYAKFLRMER